MNPRISYRLLPLLLCLLLCACSANDALNVTSLESDGSIRLELSGDAFLAMGFEVGDMVTVDLDGQSFDMPVVQHDSDVDTGMMLLRVSKSSVLIGIRKGDLGMQTGIMPSRSAPVRVGFTLKERGGYLSSLRTHQLWRGYERSDYPGLNDAEYANFRCVSVTGIAPGMLYRSSSPIDPGISRDTYAMAAMENAGIRTVIDLVDTPEEASAFAAYPGSYYAAQDAIFLDLDMNFAGDRFRAGMADALRFLGSHEGPYLVHCHEGMNRTGFLCDMLECLLGADLHEIIADHMLSYVNYYSVQPGTEQYDELTSTYVIGPLCQAFGRDSLDGTDLRAEARAYLLGLGLTEQDIAAVEERLRN